MCHDPAGRSHLHKAGGFIALHNRYVIIAIWPASYPHAGMALGTLALLPCIAGMSLLPCCLPATLM